MKQLYLIGGTMGVGKTAICRILKHQLPNSVFLDGDWCWDSDPFQVTDETKEMVMDNICHILNNFIRCSAYDNIIFCWVMHEQGIIDAICEKILIENCSVKVISLMADEKNLTKRIEKDVRAGIRDMEVLSRSIERIPLYESLNTIKINTNNKSVQQVADEITNCTNTPGTEN